ncbi:hypothetical protein J647_2963 [Acinetobacter baumannii 846928]|jgi:hypothetical protein|nr:hypothetical protein P795_8060 [Acinetobacter baumannii ZW85-1]EXE36666.1 hypothetical protein J573_2913 [Acinetobacter baumannii 1546444]EXI36763.1 hypothetical protein J647_2963 [Acinetobacter baumannii 846928]
MFDTLKAIIKKFTSMINALLKVKTVLFIVSKEEYLSFIFLMAKQIKHQ